MYIKELDEDIEDDYCYSEAAAEIVDEYCLSLQKEEGMIREPNEDDWGIDTEDASFIYTDKAQKLIEAEVAKWYQIGLKYWENGDIDIWQHLTQYREM